ALVSGPTLLRGVRGAFGAARPDDYLLPGQREPAGQAASLVPGAAEDADDQSVSGRGFALTHALHPARRRCWPREGDPLVLPRAARFATLRTDMAARRGVREAPYIRGREPSDHSPCALGPDRLARADPRIRPGAAQGHPLAGRPAPRRHPRRGALAPDRAPGRGKPAVRDPRAHAHA